jgi:hypothetical protein
MAERKPKKAMVALAGLVLSLGLTGCLPSPGAKAGAKAPANPVTKIVEKVRTQLKPSGGSSGADTNRKKETGDRTQKKEEAATNKKDSGKFVPQTDPSFYGTRLSQLPDYHGPWLGDPKDDPTNGGTIGSDNCSPFCEAAPF